MSYKYETFFFKENKWSKDIGDHECWYFDPSCYLGLLQGLSGSQRLHPSHCSTVPLVAEHHLTLDNPEHPEHEPHFADEEMLLRVAK